MSRSLRILSLAALAAAPASAQVDGISYAFSPVGAYTVYDGNAALKDQLLYGGRLGFGFGRYVELDAEYLRGADTQTTFDDFDGAGTLLDAVAAQNVGVQRMGAGLRVNVGRSRLLPFVRGGAGVVQLDPENVDATRSIYVTYGGGLTLSAAQRYTLTVEAARDVYRYSPFATYALGDVPVLSPDDFPIRTVHNLALTGSLRFYLGGRTDRSETDVDAALRRQFSGGFRLFVEPAYGQIAFNENLGAAFPAKQPFAGVSAGFDLGPYVGLRGSYLRATDEDAALADGVPTSFRDLALLGGELNLRFATATGGGGLTPYLILGGGYLQAGDDYEATGTVGQPSDRPYAQVGAGVDFPLASALRLKGAVRSLLMSDLDAADVATPSRVYGSTMWTAGVEMSLGGRQRSTAAAVNRTVEARVAQERTALDAEFAAREEAQAASREAAMLAMQVQHQAAMDSLRRAVEAAPNDSVRAERLVDLSIRQAAYAADSTVLSDSVRTRRTASVAERANVSARTISIPVPERGEIYIRYGDPVAAETQSNAPIVIAAEGVLPSATGSGTLSQADVAAIVRAELERQQGNTSRNTSTEQALRTLQATNAALLARLAALEGRLSISSTTTSATPSVVIVDSAGVVRDADEGGLLWGRQYYSTMPFLGFRTGGGVNQAIVGIRGDFRLPSGSGMRFMPEVGIGVGDGVSIQAFANTAWSFPRLSVFVPYAGIGAGLKTNDGLKGAGLAINLLAGVEVPLKNGWGFVEYSTLDFFDVNRGLIGYRLFF
ncbi:MAG: autotransporter outer membrane beta-barrel domain-containing protein [Bacteroidetes bacterium]|nr:autotransporter outer membrane beta-barrel domain-containing protein [Bacteroidota bacterium]